MMITDLISRVDNTDDHLKVSVNNKMYFIKNKEIFLAILEHPRYILFMAVHFVVPSNTID